MEKIKNLKQYFNKDKHIIFKYIAAKFWGPFLFSLGVFAVLVFVADTFENMNVFVKSSTGFFAVAKYLILTIPYWVLTIMPAACLLGCLFVISDMISSGEWLASIASGYSIKQIFLPIILCVALVGFTNIFLQEFVSTAMFKKAEEIYQVDIKGKKDWSIGLHRNVILRLSKDKILTAQTLDVKHKIMNRVVLDILGEDGKIDYQLDVDKMVWNNEIESWFFVDGVKRTFDNLGGFTEEHFDEKPSKITFPPNTIAVTTLDPEFLTIRELLGKIKFLKVLGISNYKEKTYLYHKLVTPLAFIIICLLGMPFVVLVRKANKMVNVIIALVISFGFWWMMSVTLSMGEMGYMPPILSAFLPIILSSGLIYYEFKKL